MVKTVTATGEACPEDYATLMNKAAYVKAQNDLTIQQQNEMIKMNNANGLRGNANGGMNSPGMGRMAGGGGGGGGSNNYCREAFEPISLQQQRFSPGANFDNGNSTEDDLIEAEIQRLLRQRQQLLSKGRGNNNGNGNGNRGDGRAMSGHGNVAQPYMGEESVMREYEQLMLKQRELNMMAGKLGMNGGGMGGLTNTFNGGGMNSHMMSQASGNMLNPAMNGMMGMNGGMGGGGMGGGNNFGGQGTMSGPMQSNHNPDAAKDYMNRLRSLRQGGGMGGNSSVPEQATSSSPASSYNGNAYSASPGGRMGGNDGVGGINSNMTTNDMAGLMQQMRGNKSSGRGGGPDDFTIEEYQASLQQFLSHNDDLGGGKNNANGMASRRSQLPQDANNMTGNSDAMMAGQCMQVSTILEDGSNGNDGRDEGRRPHANLPMTLNRNTIKSVDSDARPSFQSMDDMDIRGTFKSVDTTDIRGTFKSVDTMDLMSIGNSINQIMDDDLRRDPDMRNKFDKRRLSNASSRGRHHKLANVGGNAADLAAAASLSDFARLPGQTLEIRTMDHGNARASGGPRKIKKGIDPRLVAQAKLGRHSVQTKDGDGPSGSGRGSMLSIKDLNLDGVDDASRMSFGNM